MIKLLRFLKGYIPQSIIAPLFKFLEVCFELVVPIIMANIIDVGIKNNDSAYIYQMGGLLILFGVLGLGASLTAQYFAAKASMGFGTALRKALYKHINSLSYAEIDKAGTSTLLTRLINDATQVQSGVNRFLRLFMRSPFIVIGSVVMCLMINVQMTLIFAVAAPVIALIIYVITKMTIPRYKKIQGQLDNVSLHTRENLSGVRVIRAFSQQKNERDDFDAAAENLLQKQIRTGRISALLNPLTYVVVNLAIAAIIWFGGGSVNTGSLTQGELIALINYMTQILLALVMLAVLISFLTKAFASAGRINDVFDLKPSVTDDGNVPLEAIKDAPVLEFRNVGFAYGGDSSKRSLDGVSFYANKGDVIGIVGGTGSGKSTLVSLIPRFYDTVEGQVLVDGNDVKKYPLAQLHAKIGVVPQRAVLFRGTIRDNIKWGKADATDEEILNALDIAQAKEFVLEKPEKLDTMISQGGKNLSGGQRQRLTIARALVMQPEILILDDSASALDLATDARLRKALAEKIPDTTVIIVSQRAASLKNADRIIVLSDGKPLAVGSHRDLFKSCTLYRQICLTQMSEQEAEGGAV